MAPAAAPPHRGLPAGHAGGLTGRARAASPRRPPPPPAWAAATAEAARRRRRRAGGGSGDGFLGPGGLASRSVRRGRAEARELGRPPAATPAAASFPGGAARASGGSSSFVWARSPAGIRLASPPPRLPLRLRRAETGGGGSSPHRLIPALPGGNAARPGPPESPPEGPGDRRACASAERATLAYTGPATTATPSAAAHSAPGPPPSSGSQQSRLDPPPGPGAHYPGSPESPARSMRTAERAEAPARRGGAETPEPGRRRLSLPGTCPEPVPDRLPNVQTAFYTDSPSSRPSQDDPNTVPLFERAEPLDLDREKQYGDVERKRHSGWARHLSGYSVYRR